MQGDCGSISQLHLALREHLGRLHDAVFMLPRPGEGVLSESGYAADLADASRSFERLVASLPEELSWNDRRFEEESEALLAKDADADEALCRLAARADSLQRLAQQALRQTCEELGGEAVTCKSPGIRALELPNPACPHSRSESPGGKGSPMSQCSEAGDAAAVSGQHESLSPVASKTLVPRPRLQDLQAHRGRRFVEELEFVQSLANPDYVQWLAQQKYFSEPAFIEFLSYLQYWRHPPYIHHVVFPQGLRMLEVLLSPRVHTRLHRADTREVLSAQLMWKWSSQSETSLQESSSSSNFNTCYKLESQPVGTADILQDWTKADQAWHDRCLSISTAGTISDAAMQIGKAYLGKHMQGQQLLRAATAFRHYWQNEQAACDLEQLTQNPAPEASGVGPSACALRSLGLAEEMPAAKRTKR